MIVETPQKNVTVNYTYYLADGKEFSEFEKLLFKYSFLMSTLKHKFKVNIHCNENFRKVCEELNIVPDNFYPLEEDPDINFSTFWAYHKIKVYDKQPVGEWHLDVDAVFKGKPKIYKRAAVIAAHDDIPADESGNLYNLSCVETPYNYKIPEFFKVHLHGFNASTLLFNSQKLKDIYCKNAIAFMRNNPAISKRGWEYMVFIEQASLEQICEYYNYSYKFLVDFSDYYHLGPIKKCLSDSEIKKNINKLNNRIKKLCQLHLKTLPT